MLVGNATEIYVTATGEQWRGHAGLAVAAGQTTQWIELQWPNDDTDSLDDELKGPAGLGKPLAPLQLAIQATAGATFYAIKEEC